MSRARSAFFILHASAGLCGCSAPRPAAAPVPIQEPAKPLPAPPRTSLSQAARPTTSALKQKSRINKPGKRTQTAKKQLRPFSPPSLPHVDDPRAFARKRAADLLAALKAGRVRLVMQTRDAGQLERLAAQGFYEWPPNPKASPGVRDDLSEPEETEAGPSDPRRLASLPSRSAAPEWRTLRTLHTLPGREFFGFWLPPQLPVPQDKALLEPRGAIEEPAPELMHCLDVFASRSTPARPLGILSFLRPPYRVGGFRGNAGSMHAHGRAVDIHAYGGYSVALDRPEDCVQMTLALLRDLPPGRYRLGMPKSPAPDPVGGQPVLPVELLRLRNALTSSHDIPRGFVGPLPPQFEPVSRSPVGPFGAALGIFLGTGSRPWPFFPAPEAEVENGRVVPLLHGDKQVKDAQGLPRPRRLVRFRNEDYADAADLADPRLRSALEAARKRGADVFALFPDGKDHVHLDVRPAP